MAKAPALSVEQAIIVAGGVWWMNYIVAKQWGYPFLYCWFSPAAVTLYVGWATLALYVIALYVVYQLLVKSIPKAFIACLIGIGVIELPHLGDYLFRLGASCG